MATFRSMLVLTLACLSLLAISSIVQLLVDGQSKYLSSETNEKQHYDSHSRSQPLYKDNQTSFSWHLIEEGDGRRCLNMYESMFSESYCGLTKTNGDISVLKGKLNKDMVDIMAKDCIYTDSGGVTRLTVNPRFEAKILYGVVGYTTTDLGLNITRWTLQRIRNEMGSNVKIVYLEKNSKYYYIGPNELPMVDVFFTQPNEGFDFTGFQLIIMSEARISAENVAEYGYTQDGMWDHLDHVVVSGDTLTGPFRSKLYDLIKLSEASGYSWQVNSCWDTYHIRSSMLIFHKAMFDKIFRAYWARMVYPCGKFGSMFLGEDIGNVWSQEDYPCGTFCRHPLANSDTTQFQLDLRPPCLFLKMKDMERNGKGPWDYEEIASSQDVPVEIYPCFG